MLSNPPNATAIPETFIQQLDRKSTPLARVRLTKLARADLSWWNTFLPRWNRVSIIRDRRTTFTIATDASGVKGVGGIFPLIKEAFSTKIPRSHRKEDIQWKEAFAVLIALTLWGEKFRGCRLRVLCDNEAVVVGLNKRSIRGRTIHVIQQIFLVLALYDIEVEAQWIPTEENKAADALSRFKRLTNWMGDQFSNYEIHLDASAVLRKLRQELLSFTAGTHSSYRRCNRQFGSQLKDKLFEISPVTQSGGTGQKEVDQPRNHTRFGRSPVEQLTRNYWVIELNFIRYLLAIMDLTTN